MSQRPIAHVSRGVRQVRNAISAVAEVVGILRPHLGHAHDPVDIGNYQVRCSKCWRRPVHAGHHMRWVA